jgi:hypothetical protein
LDNQMLGWLTYILYRISSNVNKLSES